MCMLTATVGWPVCLHLSWHETGEEASEHSGGIVTFVVRPAHGVSRAEATRYRSDVPALVSEVRGDLERTIGSCVNSL